MRRWKFPVFAVVLLLLPVLVWASPFCVSDPYTVGMVQPTDFELQDEITPGIWGTSIITLPQDQGGGTCRVYHDIGTYSVGSHTIRIRARKVGSTPPESVWAPNFTFNHPAIAVNPSGLSLLVVGSDLYVISASYPAAAEVSTFAVTMDGGASVDSPAQVQADTTTRLYYKITGISVGSHNMTITAKQTMWSQGSAAVPYSFTNTGPAAVPTGLKIVK